MCDFIHKLVHKPFLRHLAKDFAAAEDQSLAVAACNAEVGLARLARACRKDADRLLLLSKLRRKAQGFLRPFCTLFCVGAFFVPEREYGEIQYY